MIAKGKQNRPAERQIQQGSFLLALFIFPPRDIALGEAGDAGQSHRKTYQQQPHQCRRFCRKMERTKAGAGL